jgi:two-component system OmpR family sensor kinase
MKKQGFISLKNPRDILHQGKVVHNKRGLELLFFKNSYYVHIEIPRFRILYKDQTRHNYTSYSYIFFIGILFLLSFSYFWIIKAIKPLDDLKNEIQKFANGELEISCKSDRKDEIAQVANEFDNAVNKISLLLKSRQLFLRTIMHELKTPIAKGRIVSELIENEKQKSRMITIFDKLNFQINDFAKVEQVISKNYSININSYKCDTIIKNSIEMLMIDNTQNILVQINTNKNLKVDYELISMAIKNLLDNALKYSDDKKVLVKEKENCLEFISQGEKLSKSLEEYFKPFHNDTTNKNHGMGLGLYIVNSILELHNYKFEYENKEESNIFRIIF